MKLGTFALTALLGVATTSAQQTTIRIDASQPGRAVSRFLTGSCIEDVNHEVYGGVYSQMIFGESFQEPPRGEPLKGMVSFEGQWKLAADGVLEGEAGQGPKLLRDAPGFADGEVGTLP